MGTKASPSEFDAYQRAELEEPYFCLLARDPSAPALLDLWASEREKHGESAAVVAEARECSASMRAWRDHNRPTKPDADEAAKLVEQLLGLAEECLSDDPLPAEHFRPLLDRARRFVARPT